MSSFEQNYQHSNNFIIKVEQIEKTDKIPDEGIFGGGRNLLMGSSNLKPLLKYLLSNTGKYINDEDINLQNNPCLKVAVASRRSSTLEERSNQLLGYLEENFDIIY